MRGSSALPLLASFLVASTAADSQIYDQPVIGVLAFPTDVSPTLAVPKCSDSDGCVYNQYFDAAYVQWLQQGGARVVPIYYDLPADDLEGLMSKLNGVLFTGGPAKPNTNSLYFQTATRIYELVEKFNSQGTHYPLWGTCLGFETISSIVSPSGQDAVLTGVFDSESLSLPLVFTDAAPDSKLFGQLSPTLYNNFASLNVTTNWHSYGVSPTNFMSLLSPNGLVALSTNVDRQGQPFVSTLEHAVLPVYATQWHAEANEFDTADKNGDSTPNRSSEAMQLMQNLANFFVDEARKNDNSFDDVEEWKSKVLIPVGQIGTYFDSWKYWFYETK